MSVFTQQHSIKKNKERRDSSCYITQNDWAISCVWSRVVSVYNKRIALSAGDFQLMFMRNSIKLLGSFRMVEGNPLDYVIFYDDDDEPRERMTTVITLYQSARCGRSLIATCCHRYAFLYGLQSHTKEIIVKLCVLFCYICWHQL